MGPFCARVRGRLDVWPRLAPSLHSSVPSSLGCLTISQLSERGPVLAAHEWCLVDEGCIPVRSAGGVREVGILSALLESHTVGGLAVELPTMTPVLLRQLLVPVVLDALGPVDAEAWAEMMDEGRFTPGQCVDIAQYLDKHRDRFNIFDKVQPFGQAAGLTHPKDAVKPVAELMPHVSTGNNTPLREARTDADPEPVPVGEAVRWMLHAQSWDTAAIKTAAVGDPAVKAGKTTGNRTGSLGFLGVVTPIGSTLFETIVLNIPIGDRPDGDMPQWRRDPQGPSWAERAPAGVLDLFTWQARRIRLIPTETEAGLRVANVVLSAGDRVPEPPAWEPHTLWTIKKDPKKGSIRYPRRHLPGRTGWRGLKTLIALDQDTVGVETSTLLTQIASAILTGDLPVTYPLRVETCGVVYGNMSAIVSDVLFDSMPIPVAALRADMAVRGSVIQVCTQAETLAYAVDDLAKHLAYAVGGEPAPAGKGQQPGTKLLHTLDPLVRRFLTGCQRSPDDAELDRAHHAFETLAERAARAAADELLHRLPGRAFTGVTQGTGADAKTYRQATAERFFYAALRRTLTHLYPLAEETTT
ncbi:type I-E CRISPR-associated protein Cse1/CasA [Streptomyces sp. ZAF1911]|uniref:type I-E CRISPR-associated protein Cse1/CasA n=1 Tax=Streptomyces sp. ZAF1911 TaxID=2944129 RepID=UPI00237C246C|nr:type I-E CRISPR-associated protein Cse1/CasA [Streptomyces sp. ZAF1911]MDD9380371.1 type I-E CRISPR-associated protein Cse1/CasA [Streptomyces sp. ZAF1911]